MEWAPDYGADESLELEDVRPDPDPAAANGVPSTEETSTGPGEPEALPRPAFARPDAPLEASSGAPIAPDQRPRVAARLPPMESDADSGGGSARAVVVVLLVALVMGVLGWDLYRKWSTDSQEPVKAAAPEAPPALPRPAPGTHESVHDFDCSRLAGSHGKIFAPKLLVSGTVVSDQQSMAIISNGKSGSLMLKVGDYVGDTCWRLQNVETDAVTLWSPVSEDTDSRGGQTVRIPVTSGPGEAR